MTLSLFPSRVSSRHDGLVEDLVDDSSLVQDLVDDLVEDLVDHLVLVDGVKHHRIRILLYELPHFFCRTAAPAEQRHRLDIWTDQRPIPFALRVASSVECIPAGFIELQ